MLESHVRRRVGALAGVQIRDRCEAVGLVTTPDRNRVIGARILPRVGGSAEEILRADLVVDATGRGSRLPQWLEDLDRPRPAAERLSIGIRYASRLYRLPSGGLDGDLAILNGPSPALPRGGALAAIEGDRHVLTLFGILDDAPPLNADGFHAFARSLRFPDIASAIDGAEPDTIVSFGPDGLTGHEDHQTVSAWATAARAAAAPRARLLYATTTEDFVRRWEPCRAAFDIFLAPGLPLRTSAADLRLDPELVDRKMVALRAQASQTAGMVAALGEDRLRAWWSTETFVSADATVAHGRTWGTWRVAA